MSPEDTAAAEGGDMAIISIGFATQLVWCVYAEEILLVASPVEMISS